MLFGRVAFRAGYPDVSAINQLFHGLKDMMDFTEANPATGFHPSAAPRGGDLTFVKRRVSSFTGSDLEVLLRSLDVRHLVLAGVMTSGVVLSTLREAADRDYRITVLSDGCADADPGSASRVDGEVVPDAGHRRHRRRMERRSVVKPARIERADRPGAACADGRRRTALSVIFSERPRR